MKTKLIKHIGILLAATLSFSAVSVAALAISSTRASDEVAEVQAASTYNYTTCEQKYNNGNGDPTELFNAIKSLQTANTSSYSTLWTTYGSAYVKSDGYMMDYYSSTSKFTYPDDKDPGSGNTEGQYYNREHAVPNSWMGVGTTGPGADPFIVVPTDKIVNGKRGNYPYGYVKTATYSSNGGYSKLGSSDSDNWGYSGTVFEPNDEVKGDLARIYFYAIVTYTVTSWTGGEASTCFNTSGGVNNNFGLTSYALKLLSHWNNLDPVSDWETGLNDRLASIQKNRNPFIDHPEYVNVLFKNKSGFTPYGGTTPSTDPSATITGSSSVTVGSPISLTASLSNVTSASLVAWESSDTSKATVTKGTTSTTSSVATVTGVAAGNVTISCKYDGTTIGSKTITVASSSDEGGSGNEGDAELYSGTISEGDYVIYYDGKAMKNTVSSNRLTYSTVTPSNDVISSPDSSIVWHIAASGDYWTVYNSAVGKYAAGNGTKNQAALSDSASSDSSKWTISGSSTYEFVNKGNSSNSVNANLRENGTYGFACYSTGTGGALSLYKVVESGGSSGGSDTPEKVLDSISAVYTGEDIYVDDTLDETAFTVTASYTDSSYPDAEVSEWTVSGFDSSTAGTNTVTISYTEGGVTKTDAVNLTILDNSSPVVPTGDDGEASWTASSQNKSNGTEAGTQTSSHTSITIVFDKGTNSNAPKFYGSSSHVRVYGGGTFTVTSTNFNIKKIVLTFGSGEDSNEITVNSGTYSNGTWTCSGTTYASSVVFTVGGTSGNRRIAGITVSYYSASNFSEDFLSTITCNGGSTAPSVTNWNSMRDNKYSLLFDADKTTLAGATASESGTVIEQAMARYDFIIGKYNKQSVVYANYISRSGSGVIAHNPLSIDTSTATIIIIATSMAAITIIGGALILKRKEQ